MRIRLHLFQVGGVTLKVPQVFVRNMNDQVTLSEAIESYKQAYLKEAGLKGAAD